MKPLQLSVHPPDTSSMSPPATPTTPPRSRNHDTSVKDKSIFHCTDDLEIHHDPLTKKPITFGHGVWSIVYKASARPASAPPSSVLTPPSSPASTGRIVAVKSPVRRDAHAILEAEARVLTKVYMANGAERHVIGFAGYVPRSHALVMDAVPMALSSLIEERAVVAEKNKTTETMFQPVPGIRAWCDLAGKLIKGLAWLHDEARVVHGDIKPHNVLLQPAPGASSDSNKEGFHYTPLFADFSSAHHLAPISFPITTSPGNNAITALTPPFAAPELLASLHSKSSDEDVSPTTSADVFSLAVTLLAAATGDLFLYPGTSSMQRLAMAREGHRVIEFVRAGLNGMRVPRNGHVEKVVAQGVCKEPGDRVSAGEWVGVVEAV